MTYCRSIAAGPSWAEHVVVSLLRRWVALREAGEPGLPVADAARTLGASPVAIASADLLFALVEDSLGRPLRSERPCAPRPGPDERAVLLLLATAEAAGPVRTGRAAPHGLPGALIWAAGKLRHALGGFGGTDIEPPARCPFDRPA